MMNYQDEVGAASAVLRGQSKIFKSSKTRFTLNESEAAFVAAGRVYSPTVAAKPATEEYNGSSWTAGGALSTAGAYMGSTGIKTAALAIGGTMAPDNGATTTQDWDGTTWTTNSASINEGKATAAAAGTTTAAMIFGGFGGGGTSSATVNTESWDGSSWTEVGNLATARDAIMGGQSSPNTAAVAFGGQLPGSSAVSNSTEEWNVSPAASSFTSS